MYEDLIVGSRSGVDPRDFEATIRPWGTPFRVGARTLFEVRIRNLGKTPAWLVHAADGSPWESSPGHRIEVSGPPGGFKAIARRCGNKNGVRTGDFVLVGPGEEFNPFVHGREGCTGPYGTFLLPGHYRATFRYQTTDPQVSNWVGDRTEFDDADDLLDGAAVLGLLERVAMLDLSATTTFEVACD